MPTSTVVIYKLNPATWLGGTVRESTREDKSHCGGVVIKCNPPFLTSFVVILKMPMVLIHKPHLFGEGIPLFSSLDKSRPRVCVRMSHIEPCIHGYVHADAPFFLLAGQIQSAVNEHATSSKVW